MCILFSIIAAVDKNFAIGYKNNLLCEIPDDLKRFRSLTMGKRVVVGRKTFESIKNKMFGRRITVATRSEDLAYDNAAVCCDLKSFLHKNKNTPEEIFIIGGGEIYSLSLPYTKKIYLTRIEKEFLFADRFFPDIDVSKWNRFVSPFFLCNKNNVCFRYETYIREKILFSY